MPTSPVDNDAGHVATSAGFTVSVYVFDAVAVIASVIASVLVKVPAVVGVPEIAPVAELTVSPGGSPLADQVYGVVPPVAVGAVDT